VSRTSFISLVPGVKSKVRLEPDFGTVFPVLGWVPLDKSEDIFKRYFSQAVREHREFAGKG